MLLRATRPSLEHRGPTPVWIHGCQDRLQRVQRGAGGQEDVLPGPVLHLLLWNSKPDKVAKRDDRNVQVWEGMQENTDYRGKGGGSPGSEGNQEKDVEQFEGDGDQPDITINHYDVSNH